MTAADPKSIAGAYEAAVAGQAIGATGREPDARTALDLFRSVAPDAPAAFYFDATLSYGDVDLISSRLAAYLRTNGLVVGDRVAIILQNTPQFIIAAIAAWKAGAVVVSLNPMYRTAELKKLFADCSPKAVLCQDDQWDNVRTAAEAVDPALLLWSSGRESQARDDARVMPALGLGPAQQSLAAILAREASTEAEPVAVLAPGDVALLLYTSGTTGAPKGAMLTHRNLVANALTCRDHFQLDGSSRIFGIAPLFHVTGFEIQLVAAFAAGAAQVLTYRFHPQVALDAFLEHRPTFIIGAITAFIALMSQAQATSQHFASFVHIYSGGAPIAPAVVQSFAERFGRSIRSSYGMTELTAPSHLAPNEGTIPVDPASGALSIGRPTPGTDVIVVDDARRPVKNGEHGELVVRGPQVMSGYWGKPRETAEVLVDGWMHTGDVGFVDEAGWFYLVDRKKDMISASGFKVWPREVEDTLYAFPGVREVAVVGAPDPYRGETVIAFVSAVPGAALDAAALSQFCRERLAAYKCPTEIHVVADLPKTATGKITRNKLRDDLRSR